MAVRDVAVVVGSLRKESLNRKMAKALIEIAPDSLKLEIVEIGDLALYNEDLEATATVLRRGRSLVYLDIEVRGASSNLVAKGLATYKIG